MKEDLKFRVGPVVPEHSSVMSEGNPMSGATELAGNLLSTSKAFDSKEGKVVHGGCILNSLCRPDIVSLHVTYFNLDSTYSQIAKH